MLLLVDQVTDLLVLQDKAVQGRRGGSDDLPRALRLGDRVYEGTSDIQGARASSTISNCTTTRFVMVAYHRESDERGTVACSALCSEGLSQNGYE